MTKILSSAVSNRALDALTRQPGKEACARLIPKAIGENPYGERITGGAFEAFIGALYCEVGLDDVAYFVNALMGDLPAAHDPEGNAIGDLQESLQKRGQPLPEYREVARTGPDHRPSFMYRVVCNGEVLGEGRQSRLQQGRHSGGYARRGRNKNGEPAGPPSPHNCISCRCKAGSCLLFPAGLVCYLQV